MSTYTDLHNRVKENITVDYNNRVTPQRVRFFNEQNEYWGTFRGHVSAENININGGSLNGVTLKDVILNGSVALPDGIDLHKVLQQVKQISTDLVQTGEILEQEISDRETAVEQEKIQRQQKDNSLSDEIDAQADVFVQKIAAVSAFLDEQDSSLCAALQQEACDRISNDNFLSDAIIDSRADFGREVFDRVRADEKLELSILTEAENSLTRDDGLCAILSSHIKDNEEQFSTLSIRVSDAIEHDRHYTIYTGTNTAKTTDSWPYSSKDYAINVYKPVVNDGAVYFNASNSERHEVGALYKLNHDSLYPLTFKTLEGISHPGVASALVNNWSYGFNETQKSQRTQLNGYNITFNDLVAGGQLSDFSFTVAPTLPQFHKVVLDGLMVGKVTDAYLSDYNENVMSGVMWIDTTDTDLATFNKFRHVSFNTTDLSVCNMMTERMTYLGGNKFKFEKNIDSAEFIGLYDSLNDEHYQFGRIYDSYAGVPGIVTDSDGVTDINVRLAAPWSRLVNLNRDVEFKNIIEEDVKFGDIYYNTILSASVDEMSAKFDVVKVSEMYKYNFTGIDGDGHTFIGGYVVPRIFNKTIKETSLDFTEVSANIVDVMWINAFKKTYVLTKTDLETLWTAEDADDEGNTLNIKFNGMTLFVKVTSGIDGAIVRQELPVLVDEPILLNPDTCHTHVYTTAVVDISEYKESYETPEATYNITLNAAVESESLPRYELNIDTAVTDLLKIQVPERTSDDISREFKVLINPNCYIDKLIELEFVDKDGKHVDITNNRHQTVLVPTNKWSLLQLNEINDNVFFVKDLDDNEDAHDVEFLSAAISAETVNRVANDRFLSDAVELSVNSLQNQILSNDADIADIYDRIRGGINYKGKILGEIRDSSENIVEIPTISNLFVWNTHHYSVNGYTEDTVLSNGYMYIMQTLSGSTKYKFEIEGLDIEARDYVIINCRGTDPSCNGKAIKYLTSADIDIIDAEDADVIHRPELFSISTDLQSQITSNDNDIEFLSNEVSSIHWIELSGFNFLSTEIGRLCTEISNEVVLSATNLQDQVISNDNDIEYLSNNVNFLLSVDHETVNYKGTLPYLPNLKDPVSHEDLGYNYLSTYILQDMGIHAPYRLKLGDTFRVSCVQSCLYDADHNAFYFGANDYFIINKDAMVSDVTTADVDIVRDAQAEVEKLSTIAYLSVENLQNDVDFLSSEARRLSAELSSSINALSDSISTDISALKIETQQSFQFVMNDYTGRISNLSTKLSTDIDNLSASLCGVIGLSVEKLQSQVTGNDNDIEFLSAEAKRLSTELSNNIDALSDSLSTDVTTLSTSTFQSFQFMMNDYTGRISNLSTKLSTEIDNLSASLCGVVQLSTKNLQDQVAANDSDIAYLSTVAELTLSADLYELSAGTKETSAMLSNQVKALWEDVRGGVNYKGHLKSYRDTELHTVSLSDIYLHSFTEYTADTKLNNGWLYCFTTEEPSKKYTTKDGIELENRDYILIHTHSELTAIPVKDICRDTVDIIDTADDDYVRLSLLAEVSTALSIDYVGRVADLSDSLSTTVSNDIAYLSGQHVWLSDEISAVIDLSVKNLQDQVTGNDNDIEFLSAEAKRLSTELSDNIDALSDSLSADIIKLSSNLSNDVDALSASLCGIVSLSVENLQTQIASNDVDIANIQNYISGDNSLCTELSDVKYHYNKTFVEDTYEAGPDRNVDVLKVVDSQNTENAYKLIYLSGTLVLETLGNTPDPDPTSHGKVMYKTSIGGDYIQEAATIEAGVFKGFAHKADAVEVVLPVKDASGNDVTGIGANAFQNCNKLVNIAIPDCMTSIGENAFDGCTNLQNVDVPLSVTSVGSNAFANCGSLARVKVIYDGDVAKHLTELTALAEALIAAGVPQPVIDITG